MNKCFSKEDTHMTKQAHEKVLTITNHQRETKQNHNKLLAHTCQNDCHQTDCK